MIIRTALSSLIFIFSITSRAETARIAVATNFKATAESIISAYQAASGNNIQTNYGSSGKLASHILNGATYDIFLSADDITAPKLKPFIIESTKQAYAYGKLALWSANLGKPLSLQHLISMQIDCLAIANPKLAPYGKAAQEALTTFQSKGMRVTQVVTGQSIAHAFQFVASGSCEWGMVAQAQ
jgi:molybdate transport system substrate-binding protein